MKKIIELKNITKSFDGETVLDDISLDIYDNEFLTLLGPSGCGKTTTLRLIGGFETPDKGDIIFMGENINDVPPYKRNVNTVFQRYALFPHLNVFENIAFPLREKKVDRDEIEEKVEEMLSLVALKGFEHRSVTSLSGGQQQRVAIARALVSRPKDSLERVGIVGACHGHGLGRAASDFFAKLLEIFQHGGLLMRTRHPGLRGRRADSAPGTSPAPSRR